PPARRRHRDAPRSGAHAAVRRAGPGPDARPRVAARHGARPGAARRGGHDQGGLHAARTDVRASLSAVVDRPHSARTLWTSWTHVAPSPTAEATRLMLPQRASPTTKTPGRLVSRR